VTVLTINDQSGGCRPTALQELLLKASLLDGDPSLNAWREWQAQEGLERLDHGSFRLLPLLYWNLRRQGCTHSTMGILKGIHRRAWVENRMLFERLRPALETLHRAGIPTLLLKGAPLALLYYADVALRPMSDLDILVPEDRALEAMQALEGQGWRQSTTRKFRIARKRDLSFRHALDFENADGLKIDLHWHVLSLACFSGADDDFWRDSVPMEFEGVPTRTLLPTDHLLHACAHGLAWSAIPPMRWVADASVVLSSSAIDWPRLLALARRTRVAPLAGEGLRYLADLLRAPVPGAVLQDLSSAALSRGEFLDYQRRRDPKSLQGPIETIQAIYWRYARNASATTPAARLLEFFRYLQFYWKLERSWHVWPAALRWAMTRLGRAAS
jgi:hypothetical protein